MRWLLPALAAQLAFATSVFIDKTVLEKRQPPYYLFAGLGAAFNLLVGLVLIVWVGLVPLTSMAALAAMGSGALLFLYLIPYLRELDGDDASSVGPLFLMVIPFTIVLSSILLSQGLVGWEWLGAALVVTGILVFIVSDGVQTRSVRVHSAVLMGLACLLVSLSLVGSDYALRTLSFSHVLELTTLSTGLVGMLVTTLTVARDPGTRMHLNKVTVVGASSAELVSVAGNALVVLAIARSSAALVSVTEGIEPLFLLLIGLIFTAIVPHILSERVSRRAIAIKSGGSAIAIVGLALLGRAS